jgi:hypothetical protein
LERCQELNLEVQELEIEHYEPEREHKKLAKNKVMRSGAELSRFIDVLKLLLMQQQPFAGLFPWPKSSVYFECSYS